MDPDSSIEDKTDPDTSMEESTEKGQQDVLQGAEEDGQEC